MKKSPATQEQVGEVYGRLKIVGKVYKPEPKRKDRKRWFLVCRCECGNKTTLRNGLLKSGNTKSCGCYRREMAQESTMPEEPLPVFRPKEPPVINDLFS